VGAVLLNPWIRTDATHAQAQLKHYYGRTIFTAEFWCRLGSGEVNIGASLRDFTKNLVRARRESDSQAALPERMRQGLAAYSGRVLMIISGNDLTAQEFDDVTAAEKSAAWCRDLSDFEKHIDNPVDNPGDNSGDNPGESQG
jgi:hypothetical protein